jgi:hypothetical protein
LVFPLLAGRINARSFSCHALGQIDPGRTFRQRASMAHTQLERSGNRIVVRDQASKLRDIINVVLVKEGSRDKVFHGVRDPIISKQPGELDS